MSSSLNKSDYIASNASPLNKSKSKQMWSFGKGTRFSKPKHG